MEICYNKIVIVFKVSITPKMIKLDISLQETATKFLSSYNLKIQDYNEWHDE